MQRVIVLLLGFGCFWLGGGQPSYAQEEKDGKGGKVPASRPGVQKIPPVTPKGVVVYIPYHKLGKILKREGIFLSKEQRENHRQLLNAPR